jgi:DNA-binding NarL/FixJ family response regulator
MVGCGRGMKPTRILLSDDHPVVIRGLRNLLKDLEGYEVCGEAGDEIQTLDLAHQLAPDILILDISMPAPNGLEVAAELRKTMPHTKILIVTMHDSEEVLRAAAAAGVSGYLLKSDAEDLLGAALRQLELGKTFVSPAFSPEVAQKLFGRRVE